jgi:hypothetical protein
MVAALASLNQTPPTPDVNADHDQGAHLEAAEQLAGEVAPEYQLCETDDLHPPDNLNNADSPHLEFFVDDNWEQEVPQHFAEELQAPPPPPLPVPSASVHPNANRSMPPVAIGIPAHKHAENTPDPFQKTDYSDPLAMPSIEDVHPNPGIYLLYMLVAWLHLQFHLPFRACTAVMNVFIMILKAFGMTVMPPPITSLPRILNKLDVEPTFDILPVCASCLEVYPAGNGTPSTCTRCNNFIFKSSTSTKSIPLLKFPSKSIESQLVSLLAVPGVEEAMDAWRGAPRRAGEYIDVFDGEIPKSLQDPEGHPFFRNGPDDKLKGPNGELRIALTLGVDW